VIGRVQSQELIHQQLPERRGIICVNQERREGSPASSDNTSGRTGGDGIRLAHACAYTTSTAHACIRNAAHAAPCRLATRFVVRSTKPSPSSVHVAVFSDGCDAGGPDELGGMGAPYFERLQSAGSQTLDELLAQESERGRPVHVVVYDAFLPRVHRTPLNLVSRFPN
jgi:hypothetical protein